MNSVGSVGIGAVGIPELLVIIMIVMMAGVVVWPAMRICERAGLPSWLGILSIVPIANLVLLWYVAYANWPSAGRA